MAAVFEHLREPGLATTPQRGGRALAVGGAVFVGLVLGYLGWVLPVAGASLLWPTLIVAGLGAVVAFVGFLFALHPHLRSLRVFCVLVVGFTIAAAVWTYQFAIPASVAWDGNAVPQAQRALARANAIGNPLQQCWTIREGSIGPIDAPYTECATSDPGFHIVTFVSGPVETGPDVRGGLAYTDRGAGSFADECSRHLIGQWWTFTRDDGTGGCPVGYRFHGGG